MLELYQAEACGYPQAFSHIGMINSPLYVGYAEGRDVQEPAPMGIRLGEPVVGDDA